MEELDGTKMNGVYVGDHVKRSFVRYGVGELEVEEEQEIEAEEIEEEIKDEDGGEVDYEIIELED